MKTPRNENKCFKLGLGIPLKTPAKGYAKNNDNRYLFLKRKSCNDIL